MSLHTVSGVAGPSGFPPWAEARRARRLQRLEIDDRAGLAAALHAERVHRAQNAMEREVEGWQVVGAGHTVIHEGAGDKLPAFRIIGGVLQQRLTGALGDGAMHLLEIETD